MSRKIHLKEMQEIQLSILRYIHDICEKKRLSYYLCGGTLLGAIRHKGFIPWDDDIDIFMFREDYMTLLDVLRHTNHDEFKSISFYDNEDYYYPFAKVIHKQTILIETEVPPIKGLGVYVDIFPIDGLPEDINERNKFFKRIIFYRKLLGFATSYKSKVKMLEIVKYPIWLTFKLIGTTRLLKLIDKTAMRYKPQDCQYVACSVAGYGTKEIVPISIFTGSEKSQFEGFQFCIPHGYDVYLTSLYGNYMELPPLEKRISHHNNVCFWISKPV